MARSKPAATKAPSQRQLKVGETIRHALADIFSRGEIVDEVLSQYSLTVPEVRMTPDLKLATAFMIPLGGGRAAEEAVEHLEQAQALLRGELAKRVSLKFMPELRFKVDTSFEARAGSTSCSPRPKSPATSTTNAMTSEASTWRGSAKVCPSVAGSSSTSRKA